MRYQRHSQPISGEVVRSKTSFRRQLYINGCLGLTIESKGTDAGKFVIDTADNQIAVQNLVPLTNMTSNVIP